MPTTHELLPEIPLESVSRSPTVLLIEDDVTTRTLIGGILRNAGYEVREATRLSQAMELMNERPDVVLLDGLLPDGTGLDFLQSLRSAGSLVPVLFFSSFFKDMTSFQKLTGELKVTQILRKPVDPKSLLLAVRSATKSVIVQHV